MRENDDAISGILQDIRFYQQNFLIGKLDNGISVKGNIISPQVGMEYHFQGRWEHHPRWGKTFNFNEYRTSYPKELSAIRGYLMENSKWIGPEISKKLVNTYGEKTLEVCKSDPEKVAKEISGITLHRALEISSMLKKNSINEELQLQIKSIITGLRISKRAVSKIIEVYGQDAPQRIRENPYQLIEDIDGIGFLTADEMAAKVGFEKEGRARIQAGIIHVLKEGAFSFGHTGMPLELLANEIQKLLRISKEMILYGIDKTIGEGLLEKVDDFIYLQEFYQREKIIAQKLKDLVSQETVHGIPQYEELEEDQINALKKAIENQVFILTGAPGTGKTFTIKRIISSFPEAKIALAAPTGKAAKRIYEETKVRAITIHKLLEPQKNNGRFYFTRHEKNPIDANIIILDEVSMIDVSLMASFLNAVAPSTRLIMVGDTYQLPSVGPGNILKDMISSQKFASTELTIIKRQDEGLIIRNCHRIKNGENIELENSNAKDFFLLRRNSEDSIRETIFDLLTKRLKKSYDPLKDIQVISPLREKTSLSCKALNEESQNRLNKNPKIGNCHFKIGDKVIQTKNQYELDIINGDIGIIRSINFQEGLIYVDFENPVRTVKIPLQDNNLELAYCITCHKFQGSEAPVIIIPIHRSFGLLIMQRNWLYTAVSRAKEMCILVGQKEEIPKIIHRNRQQKRFTNLAKFLTEETKESVSDARENAF